MTDPTLHVHAPLPKGYDSYSYESIRHYTSDLADFLAKYSLLHRCSADDFFKIVGASSNSCTTSLQTAERKEGSSDEADEVVRLCSAFSTQFVKIGGRFSHYAPLHKGCEYEKPGDDDNLTYEELASVIRNGPDLSVNRQSSKSPELEALKMFYDSTEKLKLRRDYKEFPRPIETLMPKTTGMSEAPSAASTETTTTTGAAERIAIRNALLGKGMCVKKQHEVIQMEETMRALIDETRARKAADNGRQSATTPALDKMTDPKGRLTVMNVGEGKGYVSRVLSLCSGVPVVGIDCNPLHKEAALDRLEPLLDVNTGKVAHRDEGKAGPIESSKKQILNLNYCRRGSTSCVTCRVGPLTDWAGVLQLGGVDVCDLQGNTILTEKPLGLDDTVRTPKTTEVLCNVTDRVQCKICQKILRAQNAAALVKHANQHREGEKCWPAQLSPDQIATMVKDEYFVAYEPPSASKRDRDADNGETQNGERDRSQLAQFARAQDLLLPQTAGCGRSLSRRVTILGYNEGARKYKVFEHDGESRSDDSTPEEAFNTKQSGVVSGRTSMIDLTGEQRAIPIMPPIWYPIIVPSLDNVVLMGLHTCGDLGSAVCRLYKQQSNVASMLLVSCCWRALTTEGFPLSNELRGKLRFNASSDHGGAEGDLTYHSLTLATQPLDSFASRPVKGNEETASVRSDEFFGGSRLVFYRSLFVGVFWPLFIKEILNCCVEATKRNETSNDTSDVRSMPSVDTEKLLRFPPPDISERDFHRSLSKDKRTLTFAELCSRVRDTYILSGDENFACKVARAIAPNEGGANVTEPYKAAISHYLTGMSMKTDQTPSYDRLASECQRKHATTKNFIRFVGFTTLRMWMSHLIEALLLADRLLSLCVPDKQAIQSSGFPMRVSLVPLFDGALSPRLFAILAVR